MKQLYITFLSAILCLLGSTTSWGQDGYATINGTVTGGAGGTSVTVTTAANLKTYAESATTYIITVSGTIDLGASGRVNLKSNKTLQGANSSATIKGTINLSSVSNVIIRNLNVTANTGAAAENDGISVNDSKNVFITKCTVYDCTDGNIDVCKGSDYVTVSWCKFYYTRDNGHNFSNLIGSSDTDTGGYHTTWHHNWWAQGCQQRMLADRFGPCHMYDNYFNCSGNSYCTTARNVTQLFVQNNYYDGVNNPLAKVESGKLKTSGVIFNNCTGTQTTSSDAIFTPPYSYTLDATANVPAMVKGGAGNVAAAPSSRSAFSTIQAETYNSMLGVQTETCSEGGLDVSYIENSDWIRFASVNFGTGATGVSVRVASNTAGGTIKFRIDAAGGTQIAALNVTNSGGWQTWKTMTATVSGVSGVHDLYLSFSGGTGYLFNLNHFVFTGGSARLATTESVESVVESPIEGSVKLFPNPAQDVLNVEVSDPLEKNAKVLIYDNVGRPVLEAKLLNRKTNVDVRSYSPGIYILKLSNGRNIVTRKFLKK